MDLYNLLHSTLFRAKDIRDKSGIYRKLSELRHEQYLNPDELQTIQLQRLKTILIHAREHSPYYADLLNSLSIRVDNSFDLSQLPEIPPLRREHLQNDLDRILCRNAVNLLRDSSGGSTGQPVNFYHDAAYSQFSTANRLLFLDWMNIKPGDKTAVFWGADRDLKDSSRYDRVMNRINRVEQLNSFSMTEQNVGKFLDRLNKVKPNFVYGYSSSLYHVAKHINLGHKLQFSPTAIRSSAETLHSFQREEIEKAFGTKVFDFYGSREVNNIAAECQHHNGLHVFGSGRIVEIVDDNGRPLPDGEIGQIAVTDLTNLYFPFIRYMNGDLASMASGACKCGRGYPQLTRLHGRTSDMIKINGQDIHGEYFTHLFYNRPDISQFQLIQEDENEIRLLIVAKDEKTVELESIRKAIIDKTGPSVNLQIEMTSQIKPGPGGKHRFTISKLNR